MDTLIPRLIEFILSHFYFVIIVVGLIYTMFFRKSPLEKPPDRPVRRPDSRMPDFGGAPVFPPKPRQTLPPVERKGPSPVERHDPRPELSGPKPVERRDPRPEFGGSNPRELRPESIPAAPLPVPRLDPAPETPQRPVFSEPVFRTDHRGSLASESERADVPIVPAVSADGGGGMRLSDDDLTRAIVWAEILGPPRARRPYRR